VAAGFGSYIEHTLQPIAAAKPLLITEFGVNALEAGDTAQARWLKTSWEGLVRARAAGGVVFEFADEWWKNYDNPRRSGNWWDRVPDPDDEKRHDLDPEEYYGLFTADRRPRPAAAAVKAMFAGGPALRGMPAAVVTFLILLGAVAWGWGAWRARRSRRGGL
jgi:hypothetical protein